MCARCPLHLDILFPSSAPPKDPGGPSKVLRIYQNLQQKLILNEHHGKFWYYAEFFIQSFEFRLFLVVYIWVEIFDAF